MVSKQCDILIHHQTRYPLVYSDGPIKVVWPESARLVIEVKTRLNRLELGIALENIKAVRCLDDQIRGIIFSFSSRQMKTVRKYLEQYASGIDTNHSPIAILLFDQGIIIHNGWHGSGPEGLSNLYSQSETYTAYRARERTNRQSLVVAYLLLIFLETTHLRGDSNLLDNPANVLKTLIEEQMEPVATGIRLGASRQEGSG